MGEENKNIFAMIEDMRKKGENATTEDLWNVIEEMQKGHDDYQQKKDAEVEALNKTIAEIIEKATKEKDDHLIIKPPQKNGRFLMAAMRNDMLGIEKYGGRFSRKGDPWDDKDDWNKFIGMSDEQQKAALGTVLRGDATTGSYLVPSEWYSEVMRIAGQTSQMMGKVTTIPMPARTMYLPTGGTGITLAWPSDETTAKSETNPTVGQETLSAKTCAAWMTWTEELEEDSIVNLVQYFQMLFGEAWAQEFDKQVLYSNASPFTGIAYDSGCSIRNMAAGKTSFADVELDDLIDMENDISTAGGEGALVNAVWIMSRYTFNILRKLRTDDGEYIYQKAADGVPATIWNRPYIISDQMPGSSSDATDTPFLILGNPKYVAHGERVGMEFKVYRDTIRNVDYDQIFLRFRIRAGFVVAVEEAFAVLETAAS